MAERQGFRRLMPRLRNGAAERPDRLADGPENSSIDGPQARNGHKRTIRGYIDSIGESRIVGWVWCTTMPRERLTVACMTRDGGQVETVADRRRGDLHGAGIGDGLHGFDLDLPGCGPLRDRDGVVRIEVVGTGETLGHKVPRGLAAAVPFAAAGAIDFVEDDRIVGWMFSPIGGAKPAVLVDGYPAKLQQFPLDREDVRNAIGVPDQTGFVFRVSGLRAGAQIELYASMREKMIKVAETRAEAPVVERSFMRQLHQASEVARQEGALAITCWDGAHNPIGRAKVLYDVATQQRPAVIISYLFEEFGGELWPPILSTRCAMLNIPWTGRHIYEDAIRRAGLQFDMVWICKPRYPSFLLARLVAGPRARLLLDIDDNEEHFSKSPAAKTKPYGFLTISMTRQLMARLPTRTAASITLRDEFSAHMLRHARAPHPSARRTPAACENAPIKLGFIGTARPHKRLVEVARSVRVLGWTSGTKLELHVCGDVQPAELIAELKSYGAVVEPHVPMNRLFERLSDLDVILTGFPAPDEADADITRYQISSKIGDALAANRPVLVPRSPSTADLGDVPGVFLFDECDFGERLAEAVAFRGHIGLPAPFTLDGAHAAFAEAVEAAGAAPRAAEALALLPENTPTRLQRPALVLVWKQHDAGLYGRRIDQVARAYKAAHPDYDVVILELMQKNHLEPYRQSGGAYHSEQSYLLELSKRKMAGFEDVDGVRLHQIYFETSEKLPGLIQEFLLRHALLPTNAVIVLFPIVQFLEHALDLLQPYRKIADIVDNQITWSSEEARQNVALQYHVLLRVCNAIVFNSEANRAYFDDRDLLPQRTPCEVIPNWYCPPAGLPADLPAAQTAARGKQIVYSGNMHDRINWALLGRVVDTFEDVTIHLVGTVKLNEGVLPEILVKPNVVFHGPKPERETLHLLRQMDLAIVPHVVNRVSAFMNPLKVQMYEAVGLPAVATNVAGIEASDLLKVAENDNAFIDMIAAHLAGPPERMPVQRLHCRGDRYIALVDRLLSDLPVVATDARTGT